MLTIPELQRQLAGLERQREEAIEIKLKCEGGISILQFLIQLEQQLEQQLEATFQVAESRESASAPRSLPAGSELPQLETEPTPGDKLEEIECPDPSA